MVLFHMAFSLALIALVLGGAFYVWSSQTKTARNKSIRLLSLVILAFAALNALCTAYYGVKSMNETAMNMGGGSDCKCMTKS